MAEQHVEQLDAAVFEVRRAVLGQDRAVERLFACLLAGAGCLVESPPGSAESLLVDAMSQVVGPELVRLGTPGEAPAESGELVVLTLGSDVEGEGVRSLPLAMRDRFLMGVVLGYPSRAEEVELVQRMDAEAPTLRRVLSADDVARLRRAAVEAYVDRGVVEYAVSLAQATRDPAGYGMEDLAPLVSLGVSPRASAGLVAAGRALAVLRGRAYTLPQDVFDVAPEVLRHRIVLSNQAVVQGVGVEQVLIRLLSTVPAPRIAPSQHVAEAPTPPTPPPAPPVGGGAS